jgi:hypothetical protein
METFLDRLEEEGLTSEVVRAPEARDYLSWRVRMAFAQRADHYDHAVEYQAERDVVLAKAIRLLEETNSQVDLMAVVDSEAAESRKAEASGSPPGSSSGSSEGGG